MELPWSVHNLREQFDLYFSSFITAQRLLQETLGFYCGHLEPARLPVVNAHDLVAMEAGQF